MVAVKKNYHHGSLKEQLIEAVRQLIEENGPDAWTTAQACRLAGVSTAAPYKHFKDREDIVRHVVLDAMGRMGDAMQAAADAHPPRDPLRIFALGKAYIDFARNEPGLFAAMFGLTNSHADDPELTAEGQDKLAIVMRVVAEHLDLPMGHQDVRARAYALWCAVHGHAFLVLDKKAENAMEDVSEDSYLLLVGSAYLS